MAKKDENAVLIKVIKDHTKKWETKFFKVNTKISEKAAKLSKLLGELSHGKSDKGVLAKILTEAVGEQIVVEAEEDVEFRAITALVLTKLNTTDAKHGYETEKVLISLGDGTAVTPEGAVGTMIPKKRSIMRVATEEEIDSIPKVQLDKLKDEVHIIIAE